MEKRLLCEIENDNQQEKCTCEQGEDKKTCKHCGKPLVDIEDDKKQIKESRTEKQLLLG